MRLYTEGSMEEGELPSNNSNDKSPPRFNVREWLCAKRAPPPRPLVIDPICGRRMEFSMDYTRSLSRLYEGGLKDNRYLKDRWEQLQVESEERKQAEQEAQASARRRRGPHDVRGDGSKGTSNGLLEGFKYSDQFQTTNQILFRPTTEPVQLDSRYREVRTKYGELTKRLDQPEKSRRFKLRASVP